MTKTNKQKNKKPACGISIAVIDVQVIFDHNGDTKKEATGQE